MRVVVVGATGNVGTALLRRLRREPRVTSIVGVSRRGPERGGEPYDGVEWRLVDASRPESSAQLEASFQNADVVIDLLWAIRPNRDDALLRATNVDGNRRVFEAAAAAGVPRLVVASSIGAYGRADKRSRKDESWPTTGTPSSHYAAQKAEVERILDAFEREHPEVSVARLRPGLIFQADAGPEVKDYFLGALIPAKLVARVRLPVIPFPKGVRAMAVHADDVAEAYWLVAQSDERGAFNVAAEPVIGPRAAAQILGASRALEVPPGLLRAAAAATYRLRLQPTDPGWIDMAVNVPAMDTSRIRALGWRETRSSIEAVRELLDHLDGREGLGNEEHRSRSPLE